MLFSDVYSKHYNKKIIDSIPIKHVFNEIDLIDFYITMRDGVKLFCKAAFPKNAKELPIILTRTPYGMQSLRFFHEMAFYGYICIAQNCRGCFESEGEWVPAKNERNDGIDTINYIKSQPYCNGNIAMTGASYITMNQFMICDILPPEVKTLNFEVYNPYRHDILYTNGMFHLEAYAGWLAYNSGITELKPNEETYKKMINFTPQMYADENVLGKKLDWYRQWLKSDNKNAPLYNYGAYGILKDLPSKIKVPIIAHASWYDPHFAGMLKAFENMPKQTRDKSTIIITPTNHKQALCSDNDTPNAFKAVGTRFIRSKLNWFGHHLKGEPYFDPTPEGNIKAYVYNKNDYIVFKNFNLQAKNNLFINTNNMTLCHSKPTMSVKEYIYDPLNPAPTCGSEALMTDYMYHKNKKTVEGRRIIPPVGYRNDIISFVSEYFEKDILINNDINVYIYVSSSAPDTCFYTRLSVIENGKDAFYLRSGITTLKNCITNYKPNSTVNIKIQMAKISALIKSGMRLRLDITSSDFPAFNAHPNTLKLWAEETNAVKAVQKIYGGRIEF